MSQTLAALASFDVILFFSPCLSELQLGLCSLHDQALSQQLSVVVDRVPFAVLAILSHPRCRRGPTHGDRKAQRLRHVGIRSLSTSVVAVADHGSS